MLTVHEMYYIYGIDKAECIYTGSTFIIVLSVRKLKGA